MNLILLSPEDFLAPDRVELRGRRFEHVARTHRATVGDRLVVGVVGGEAGSGEVTRLTADSVELRVVLDSPASTDYIAKADFVVSLR